jgi:non-specific serine/threonine protein kinase
MDIPHSIHTELGDAGEHLDAQAKATYKQRLRELRAELDEAQAFNDLGRTDKIQAEIDFLTAELTRAVGLGGRVRKAASPLERARVNVTLAVKTALKRVTVHHATLGQYLARTIKTGYTCVYTPDPSQPVTWED